jgi:hypothetical protein
MTCPLNLMVTSLDRVVAVCNDHLAGQLLAERVRFPEPELGLQLLPSSVCVECEVEAWLAGDDEAERAQFAPNVGHDHFACLAHPAGPCLMGCGLCAAY